MSPAAKVSEFHREGNDWFCRTGLTSDITVVVDDVKFHLHKVVSSSVKMWKASTDV